MSGCVAIEENREWSMTIEERMDRMEAAYGTQSELIRELRDAVTVTAALEARQGRLVKEHGEWLAFHDKAMKEHDQRMKEHDERMKTLDDRIANLVSGFGEFMRRNNEKMTQPRTGQ
jgi:uncharacterized coiled-coil protein SlyX